LFINFIVAVAVAIGYLEEKRRMTGVVKVEGGDLAFELHGIDEIFAVMV
jgi:hypothetical protein